MQNLFGNTVVAKQKASLYDLALERFKDDSTLLKEVVDEDKLNDALYQGELDPALFKDCLIEKTNYAVTFKRRKQDA